MSNMNYFARPLNIVIKTKLHYKKENLCYNYTFSEYIKKNI